MKCFNKAVQQCEVEFERFVNRVFFNAIPKVQNVLYFKQVYMPKEILADNPLITHGRVTVLWNYFGLTNLVARVLSI